MLWGCCQARSVGAAGAPPGLAWGRQRCPAPRPWTGRRGGACPHGRDESFALPTCHCTSPAVRACMRPPASARDHDGVARDAACTARLTVACCSRAGRCPRSEQHANEPKHQPHAQPQRQRVAHQLKQRGPGWPRARRWPEAGRGRPDRPPQVRGRGLAQGRGLAALRVPVVGQAGGVLHAHPGVRLAGADGRGLACTGRRGGGGGEGLPGRATIDSPQTSPASPRPCLISRDAGKPARTSVHTSQRPGGRVRPPPPPPRVGARTSRACSRALHCTARTLLAAAPVVLFHQ